MGDGLMIMGAGSFKENSMSAAAEKILAEGLQLPVAERKHIVQELWNSLPESEIEEWDDPEFWAEMDRRDREMDAHPEKSLTHEEVMASVREAIRCASDTMTAREKN
jgi:putative addiction module component (TIGR02574 family)